jgi:ubiquinol-cytochrome c reductase iron-sulfur subunit
MSESMSHDGDPPDERPRRVIGTPPPAGAASLFREPSPVAAEDRGAAEPELPAAPADLPRARRAERVVATLFLLAMVAGIAFIAAYVIVPVHSPVNVQHSNLALGATLGLALLFLAAGVTIWVRSVMPDVELTESRKPLRSSPDDRAAFEQTFDEGAAASQFVSRPLLRRTLIAASAPLALAPLVLLRDLSPVLPGTLLDHTVWKRGMRLLNYGPNTPITPAEFSSPGGMITVVPEGFENDFNAIAKAACIIIKFAPGQITFTTKNYQVPGHTVENWTVDNIVAYSKICTHVGCPAALYEQTTHHILCPCHQSTFDAARGAAVLFGPATRPLPQLPMTTDAQGFLVARHDFTEPVGPTFWERS